MSDDDLDLLRGFGSGDPEPPAGFAERLAERMLQQVMAAEALAGTMPHRRPIRWWSLALRQAPVAAVAASIVVLLSFDGSQGGGATAQALPAAMPVLSKAATTMQAEAAQPTASSTLTPTGTVQASSVHPTIPDQLLIVAGPSALDDHALAAIPTDPDLLVAMLHGAIASDGSHDIDFEPFRIANEYITSERVPGPVRAAFLRAVSRMQGVDLGGDSTDVIGRSGIVIARLDSASGIRQQYLMDPDSGEILEHREFTTRGSFGDCPSGTLVALDLYDDAGAQVNEDDVRAAAGPDAWPAVTPGCA